MKEESAQSENGIFQESGIFGWFLGFFSSLVCRIELILFSLVLYFFLIGLDIHNLREGSKKKSGKSVVFCQTGGGVPKCTSITNPQVQ